MVADGPVGRREASVIYSGNGKGFKGMKTLMTGNEAIARGAYEYGI